MVLTAVNAISLCQTSLKVLHYVFLVAESRSVPSGESHSILSAWEVCASESCWGLGDG